MKNLVTKVINNRSGISLLALVITIIILLILAGISIGMLSGDNSIIKQAKRATIQTTNAEEKEILEHAIVVTMGKSKYGNVEKQYLDSELNKYSEIDDTEYIDGGIEVTFKSGNVYIVDADGNVNEPIIIDRTGINVGDYITYISPTESVTFYTTETGYSSEQTLPAKSTFRVMDIDKYGNMTLIGAMTSADPYIFFRGPLGYNNAVYTLNTKCNELYKDTSKGITARSIKVEDITDKMIEGTKGETLEASKGRKKIEKYQDQQVAALSIGTYIIATDTTNNTATYQTRTNYPDIFQYEAGGLIDNTETTGIIGQSESYSGYGGLTTLTNKTPAPTYLTVPGTYYYITPDVSDFDNTNGYATAYQNMFFDTKTYFWLASRCVSFDSSNALFHLRYVCSAGIGAQNLCGSSGSLIGRNNSVCPVVSIPSSVNVTVCTGDNSNSNPHTLE